MVRSLIEEEMTFLEEQAVLYRPKAELQDKKIIEQRKRFAFYGDRLVAPTIREFFQRKCVFITGGTGLVGKVLTEKLLRSCPGIDKIYFLIRGKKGKSPEERLQTLFQSELFERLRKRTPDAVKKVVPIVGDISELNLGMSKKDRDLLQHRTSVVFHVAANVRFVDPFYQSIIANTRATKEVVELCKSMPNLKAMVYVSTSYCNTEKSLNEEVVYPAHLHWRDILKIVEKNDPTELHNLHGKLIGKHPNIYTFTKRLAENIVDDAKNQIPVIICRPSMVTSTISDPLPGWCDNFSGAVGLYLGVATGVVRAFWCSRELVMHCSAVDYVTRELILLAWIRGCNLKINPNRQQVDVVNVTVRPWYPTTQAEMIKGSFQILEKYPSMGIRKPIDPLTNNKFYHKYRVLTAHVLFAIVVDTIARIAGKEPRLLRIYRKIQYANNAVSFFVLKNQEMTTEMYLKSISLLKEEDLWDFDQKVNFDYVKYSYDATAGVYKYVLHIKPDFEWNRRLQKVLTVVHYSWILLKMYTMYCFMIWALKRWRFV